MDIPKLFSLSSTQGEPAGVMLLAPDTGSASGDCVFMLMPASIAGIESDMGMVVSELKVAGEHRFSITTLNDGISLVVLPDALPQVEFQLDRGFKGSVITEFGGASKRIGSAQPLRDNA